MSHPLTHKLTILPTALCVLLLAGCATRRPSPILVEPQGTLTSPSYADAAASLKVVTYNIWGLPCWINRAKSSRYPQIARELQQLNPDIILIQEAWTAKSRKSVPTNGLWSVARAAGQHSVFQQNGLMTLSKFPILGGEFYRFSRSGFPDQLANKGVLKVSVLFQGGLVLNVWNVHLDSGRSDTEIRRSQIRELLAHVEAAQDGQCLDLVGGDFNCTPESASYRELASALGPNVQQAADAQPFITWQKVSPKPGPGRTVDYIFVRSRGTGAELKAALHLAFSARKPQDQLSDHLGIEAVVTLNPETRLANTVGAASQLSSVESVSAETMFGGSE